MIVVTPKSSVQSHRVNVAASGAKRLLTLEALFPIVEGFFGPLRIPLPRTPAVLDSRFKSKWRT